MVLTWVSANGNMIGACGTASPVCYGGHLCVLQWAVQARLSATAMFSAMCTAHSDGSRPPLGPQGAGVEGQGAVMRAQVAELSRDNGILKRAVAIQNARLQVNPPNPRPLQTLQGQDARRLGRCLSSMPARPRCSIILCTTMVAGEKLLQRSRCRRFWQCTGLDMHCIGVARTDC